MATEPPAGRPPGAVVRALARSPMADHHLVIFATVILTAIGTMMVLSSSAVIALDQGESPYYYVIRQLAFLVIGLILVVPLSRIRPEVLMRLANIGWAVALLGLILVQTPLGFTINGNRNWIRVGTLFTIQPSEFAKLALILWGAALFHKKRGRLHEPVQLLLPFVPGALVLLALILAGRDLGTGLIFGALIFILLFFVGTPLRVLIPALLAAVAVVVVLVMGSPNRMARFLVFVNPQANTDLSSQPMSALYALASGGWWGLGLGASKQKWGGLKDGAHTDFVFAVLGEELGLFGVLLVIGLLALLARCGFQIALKSDKLFNRIAAAGITSWFLVQGLVNIMVVMNLLPVL
ncbi:MAG: FtsW/RodA/SpoVE family cell cycle protein, partial [Propionibacteriaceae bacterium]|nr:FtsW/RodA/SpoVE family cell cycle protein [Propionibacteriaceae bacterium]